MTDVSGPRRPRARHSLQVFHAVHHSRGRVFRDRKLGRLAVLPKLLNVCRRYVDFCVSQLIT